jgi:hypothetical protein
MKTLHTILEVLSVGSGFVGAIYWYRSSRVEIIPFTKITGDPDLEHHGWTVATMQAFSKSAEFNKIAAIWSAITVLTTGLSAFF